MVAISLVVMTYNEEQNIARCLQSVQGLVDECLVVDSYSEDATVEIARQNGARVIQHPFEGHVQQRDYSIRQASHEKVLVLDADEAIDDRLYQSILEVKKNWTHDCYRMNRLSSMGERWIRHGGWYPDTKFRLFDRAKYRVVGTNPHDKLVPIPGASQKKLKGDILHYTNSSVEDRVDTVNRFSSIAAQAMYDKGKRGSLLRVLVKPSVRFFIEYFVRRGFLDGLYGLVIARTSAHYVFYREVKLLILGKKKQKS